VTQCLIDLGCIDFIMKGAEALGPEKVARPAMVKAAVRALDLWLDFDNALLFKPCEVKPRGVRAAEETE